RIPTLEERMDDVRAVMDAAGSERAAIIGVSGGGPMSLLFAATYPERVQRLVLWGSAARWGTAPGYEIGHEPSLVGPFLRMFDYWGNGKLFRATIAQDVPADEVTDGRFARYERNAATPTMARAIIEFAIGVDVRDVLPKISVPTLVVHRSGDPFTRVEFGRYLGAHIPGARYSEFPGDFNLSGTGADAIVLDEIEAFLTGDSMRG
ncbi:MAG: alpha/beta hydrolase, partial [Actinobacteria bacterium]|nr:alpha/beta hydrolase [Actinomycetota bacterium]